MADLLVNSDDALKMGVHMGDGFLDTIFALSDFKEYIRSSSRTQNGERITLVGKPVLDSRKFTLQFTIKGAGMTLTEQRTSFKERKKAFYDILSNGKLTIQVPSESDDIFRLYCISKSSTYGRNNLGTFAKVSVRFEEPNPANRGKTDNENA